MAPVSPTLWVADRTARTGPPGQVWWRARPPRESKHLALIKRTIGEDLIRAHADGIELCLAVTDEELVIGRARWFGSRVDRYRLSRLLRLQRFANLSIDLLELEFAALPPTRVIIFYEDIARPAFAAIIDRLQRRLAPRHPARVKTRSRRAVHPPERRARHLRAV